MARKKSQPKSKPASKKKAAKHGSTRRPARTSASKKTGKAGPLEFDDIELLNAHRYPESLSPSQLARIRNSRAAQERLKQLLKGMPSSKNTKERDISVLLRADPEETESTEEGSGEEGYEYEYEYVEEEAPPSKMGKFFRRRNS